MKNRISPIALRGLSALLLLGLAQAARAQATGLLYDPEPPPNSAYVRVIQTLPGALDVIVDGQIRIRNLGAAEASDYMVLSAGKHTLEIHPAGKSAITGSAAFEAAAGHASTLVFSGPQANAKPLVFEDKTNSNKLKATLSVYYLSTPANDALGTIDVLTADGALNVFSRLAPGTMASRAVNPIPIELIAAKSGGKTALGRASLILTQGGSYSMLLLPGENGKLLVKTAQNKVERYTGK